jgi:hypothetical protein
MTELAQHDIEDGVLEWKRFNISLMELNGDARHFRILLRLFEQRRRKVESGSDGAQTRRRNSDHARSASHIQNPFSGMYSSEPDQLERGRSGEYFERGKESPPFALGRLHLSKCFV